MILKHSKIVTHVTMLCLKAVILYAFFLNMVMSLFSNICLGKYAPLGDVLV